MTTPQTERHDNLPASGRLLLSVSDQRTLDAIYRHPVSHNLEWSDAVALLGSIGAVEHKSNNEFVFRVADEQHLMRKPHTKDLTAIEVVELRKFLSRSGWTAEAPVAKDEAPVAPDLMVVLDHHEAKIYHLDVWDGDASAHSIKPYDPHHFLHHMAHKDQSRERGQRETEDPSFYERIVQSLKVAGRIVVVGHGQGKSDAAHHLIEYISAHHRDISQRVIPEVVADLSSITVPQLLILGQQVLARPST